MNPAVRDAEDFAAAHDVSRETVERIETFLRLLRRWNSRINLVSKRSLGAVWGRHVEDSAQLWQLCRRQAGLWVDLGAGAGFPGVIVAILAAEQARELEFALIESDARKLAFLDTVARACKLDIALHCDRIERVAPLAADIVSARALAPLERLLEMSEKHRSADGICLFPKGETVHKEIAAAQKYWQFDHTIHPSRTRPGSAIVEIREFWRADHTR